MTDVSTHPDRLLGMRDVTTLTSLSRTTIYELISAGRFPRGIEVTKGRKAWAYSDVLEWVRDRIKKRPE